MRNIKKKINAKALLILIMLLGVVAVFLWVIWSNTTLGLTKITVSCDRLPQEFCGYKIALISDLHNAEMGENNDDLIKMLRSVQPDIIAVTGDLIDSKHTDTAIAIEFMRQAVTVAPCYYVTGNHESLVEKSVYSDLERKMISAGVTVLHNREVFLDRNGARISLAGMDDLAFSLKVGHKKQRDVFSWEVETLFSTDGYKILLSHRPNFFAQYCDADVDLVLCGHAHGGQFRLPFVGGLFAPGQGIFPEYDAGLYAHGNTNMVVSRGIGNSTMPIRFNNRPEVVLVELTT